METAFEIGPIIDLPFKAGADLSAKQYHQVEMTATGIVNVCNGAGDAPIGVLQNKPKTNEAAIVRMLGISRLVADAALAVGDNYGTSADGQAVAKTAQNDLILGRILTAAGAAGEIATGTVNGLSLVKLP